jgi:hypothetical protein
MLASAAAPWSDGRLRYPGHTRNITPVALAFRLVREGLAIDRGTEPVLGCPSARLIHLRGVDILQADLPAVRTADRVAIDRTSVGAGLSGRDCGKARCGGGQQEGRQEAARQWHLWSVLSCVESIGASNIAKRSLRRGRLTGVFQSGGSCAEPAGLMRAVVVPCHRPVSKVAGDRRAYPRQNRFASLRFGDAR